jgi:hypothetical protein
MSAVNFEWTLRQRMQSHAAEFDRALRPAPELSTLVASRGQQGRLRATGGRRLVLAVAGVALLVFAAVSGSFLLGDRPATGPLSSVTPASIPAALTSSPAGSASPSLQTASTSPSASYSPSPAQPSMSQANLGFVWSAVRRS